MKDGRNGGGRRKQPVREIPFAWIERDWSPSPLDPFIVREDDDWVINVLTYVSAAAPAEIRTDYFRCAADGTVLSAPRGSAKDYKPGRITGLDEALARHGAS